MQYVRHSGKVISVLNSLAAVLTFGNFSRLPPSSADSCTLRSSSNCRYTHMYKYIHIYIYICTSHLNQLSKDHIYVCMYIHRYMYMYIHVYTCIQLYICMKASALGLADM
jgi:hypothetical protein